MEHIGNGAFIGLYLFIPDRGRILGSVSLHEEGLIKISAFNVGN